MRLEEIREFVEAKGIFPLVDVTESNGHILVEIGTGLPNGEPVVSSFAISPLEVVQNTKRGMRNLLAYRLYEANSALERLIASVEPASAWDGMKWAE